jgi:hypothetical protein
MFEEGKLDRETRRFIDDGDARMPVSNNEGRRGSA